MPAKMIVVLMMITLVVLFMLAKRFREKEIKREKLEIEEFEALQKGVNLKKDL